MLIKKTCIGPLVSLIDYRVDLRGYFYGKFQKA